MDLYVDVPENCVVEKIEKLRGFAAIKARDPQRMQQIAQQGGQKAQSLGKGHQFTREEVRRGGKSGGLKISMDRQHMSDIGRKGGSRPRPKKEVVLQEVNDFPTVITGLEYACVQVEDVKSFNISPEAPPMPIEDSVGL